MMKLLKRDWPEAAVEEAFSAIGLDETIRAERVTIEQFAELTQRLSRAEIYE